MNGSELDPYTVSGWERWRGSMDERVKGLTNDIATIKQIGLIVAGAVATQLFITAWNMLTHKG